MDGSEIVLPENELFLVTFTAAVQSSLQAETGSDLLQDWQLKRGIYVTANGGWNAVTTERGVLLADEDTVRNGDGLATSTLTASGLVESGYDGAHKINTFLGVSVGFGMPEARRYWTGLFARSRFSRSRPALPSETHWCAGRK